jgi:L-aspartate semialdehyde sulfurtransferase ferredoxin
MININIDEKACVGCTLCVDYCQTGVFSFNDEKRIAEVAKPKECFGCLSCSEICPATAIVHDGVQLSEAYYHDPNAVRLASAITAGARFGPNIPVDREKWEKALVDLGVRLLSIASVFRQTVGSGLPAVGTLAGRTLAGQLPRYRSCGSLEEALILARDQFAPAWEMDFKAEGEDRLIINIKGCFVRELCQREKIDLGGDLCTLFFYYLSGYTARIGNARLRLMKAERGATCCFYEMKKY